MHGCCTASEAQPDCYLQDQVQDAASEFGTGPIAPGCGLGVGMDGKIVGGVFMKRREEAEGSRSMWGGPD